MGVGKTTGSPPWHMKWDITRNFNTVVVNGVEVKEVRIDGRMDNNENMCKVITSGYCPYADGVDEDVKSCADCPWNNPESERRFFEEILKIQVDDRDGDNICYRFPLDKEINE